MYQLRDKYYILLSDALYDIVMRGPKMRRTFIYY